MSTSDWRGWNETSLFHLFLSFSRPSVTPNDGRSFFSAAANIVIGAKDRGLSDGWAFTLGTLAGAAEIITEKVSLETLLDKSALGKEGFMRYLAKNVLAEGSEEAASDLINWSADLIYEALARTGLSEWESMIREIQAEKPGTSRETAIGIALGRRCEELGLDALGGALSGGLMAMGGGAIDAYNTARIGRDYNLDEDTVRALLGEGLAAEEGSRSRALAEQYSAMLDGGQSLSNWQVGRQVRANEADIAAGQISENEQAEADRAEVQRYYDALGLEMPEATNAQLAPQEKTGYNDNVNMLLDAMAANSRAEEEIARRFRLLSLYEEGRLGKAAAQETELAGVVPYSESSALMAPFPAATASFRAAGGVGPYSVETNPSVSASADSSPARGARGMNGKENGNGRAEGADGQRAGRSGDVSQRAGEPGRAVSEGPEGAAGQRRAGAQAGGAGQESRSAAGRGTGEAREIDARELIPEAREGQTVRVLNDPASSRGTREGVALARQNGVTDVAAFEGEIGVTTQDGAARAFYDPQADRIGAQTNNREHRYADLVRHEIMERMLSRGRLTVAQVREAAEKYVSPRLIGAAEELYYNGLLPKGRTLTAEEQAELREHAASELICDGGDHINQLRYGVDHGTYTGRFVQLADVLNALNRAANELTGNAFVLQDGAHAQANENAATVGGGTRFSSHLKGEKNGKQSTDGRKETDREFNEKWNGKNLKRGKVGRTSYGYSYARKYETGLQSERGRDELKRLGVKCFVYKECEIHSLGYTVPLGKDGAFTIENEVVAIPAETNVDGYELAGHEAFHVWAKTAPEYREKYIRTLKDCIDYYSDEFALQYQHVERY